MARIVVLLLALTCWFPQVFTFSSNIHYAPGCNRWIYEGNITVTSLQMKDFGSNVTVQISSGDWATQAVHTTSKLCVIDLTEPPSLPTTGDDVCHVTGRIDDVYTYEVSRELLASQSGKTLEIVQVSERNVSNTYVVSTIGQIPDSYPGGEPEITYQIGDESIQTIGSANTTAVTLCRNMYVPVKFCTTDDSRDHKLTVFANGQEITSLNPCIDVGYRFNLTSDAVDVIKLEYEDLMCHHTRSIIMSVAEREPNLCNVHDAPCEVSPETACLRRPSSKARELVTLSDGRDVMCDTETDGGNWIVFQRRNSSDVDFYLGWDNYTAGFGDLSGNFWLGLDNVHSFCPKSVKCELRVDFGYQGKKYYATYQDFSVEGPQEKFKLHVGQYSGNAGDALPIGQGNGNVFSTKDNDETTWCAERYRGAWWYGGCHYSNLNGLWGSKEFGKGVNWEPTTTHTDSVSFVEMKLRINNK